MRPFAFLLAFFTTFSIYSQELSVGTFLGVSDYEGDLAPNSFFISFSKLHPAYGLFVRYAPTRWAAVRLGYTRSTISGDDANSKNPRRKKRNLSFRSSLDEISFLVEIIPFGLFSDWMPEKFNPYFFTGVAGFHFNPKTLYNNKWVELQPLGTEGQGTSQFPDRKKYARHQVSLPLGAGLTWQFNSYLTLGFEVGFRKTFTDYLDDVSQTYASKEVLLSERGEIAALLSNRSLTSSENAVHFSCRGDSTDKDWYIFSGFTFRLSLNKPSERYGEFHYRFKKVHCPKRW